MERKTGYEDPLTDRVAWNDILGAVIHIAIIDEYEGEDDVPCVELGFVHHEDPVNKPNSFFIMVPRGITTEDEFITADTPVEAAAGLMMILFGSAKPVHQSMAEYLRVLISLYKQDEQDG